MNFNWSERSDLVKKRIFTKSHSISGNLIVCLLFSSLLPLKMLQVRKKNYLKESERRRERKRREGTFLLQMFEFYSDDNKNPLISTEEEIIDIERWSTSHEQQYTSEQRKLMEEKWYKYEKDLK